MVSFRIIVDKVVSNVITHGLASVTDLTSSKQPSDAMNCVCQHEVILTLTNCLIPLIFRTIHLGVSGNQCCNSYQFLLLYTETVT